MKISWGTKIAIVYSLFVIGIGALVLKANGAQQELVTADYYEQELKYQDVINQKAEARSLSALPRYTATGSTLQIELPGEFDSKEWKGHISLYRPSDASLDVSKDFAISGKHYTFVPARIEPGIYTVKFNWELAGKKYFDERTIRF